MNPHFDTFQLERRIKSCTSDIEMYEKYISQLSRSKNQKSAQSDIKMYKKNIDLLRSSKNKFEFQLYTQQKNSVYSPKLT